MLRYRRRHDGQELLILIDLAGEPRSVAIGSPARLLISTADGRPAQPVVGTVGLSAFEGVVLDVSG